jgi:O-antigen ligase
MQTSGESRARLFLRISRYLDILIIFSTLLIINSTATTFTSQFPVLTDITDPAWSMVGAAVFMLLLMALQIKILSLGRTFVELWKQQKALIIFLIFCAFTLLWSTYELASLYEFSLMLFATLAASYFVIRFPFKSNLKIVYWFGVITAILSVILLLTNHDYSRLENAVFNGAWRGIFWHRNHMGSLMAFFSALFMYEIVMNWRNWKKVIFNFVLFMTASVLAFGSWSATGIIIYFILNSQLVLALLWLRFRDKLTRKHYLILLGVFLAALLVLIFNLDHIFQVLRRSSTLTGRTPIWEDMLVNLWPQKPLFGYGFGAIWNQEYYRVLIQTRHSWGNQVFFADNGFLDLLLNTGAIGLGLFLVFFIRTGIQAFKLFIRQHDLNSIFPVLVIVYVFWANISYSFLSEVDQFVWMLLILSAFLTIRLSDEKTTVVNKSNSPQP